MEQTYQQLQEPQASPPIHWGHFGVVLAALVLLLGMTWMKKPELFSFHKAPSQVADDPNVPHYYAYVPPAEDTQPQVLGASTDPAQQGPMVINDDGSLSPVDIGQVLGASTKDVVLSLDAVKVSSVPDSAAAIKKYFSQAQAIESGAIDQAEFASSLASNNQEQINQQAAKLTSVNAALQKLAVPQSLVKLQKLKIIQYTSGISLLQNYTQADQNPDQVSQDLQQFMKSQQDLDAENSVVAQKFPDDDPVAGYYNSPGAVPLIPIVTDSSADSNAGQSLDVSAAGLAGQ